MGSAMVRRFLSPTLNALIHFVLQLAEINKKEEREREREEKKEKKKEYKTNRKRRKKKDKYRVYLFGETKHVEEHI